MNKSTQAIMLILTICLTFSLVILIQDYKREPLEVKHSLKVTSLCMEYAKAERVDYNPVTKQYSFNGLTVSENVLIASCK